MITDSDYMVVYGTLRPAFSNPFAHYLRQHSQCIGEVSFSGQLFDLGNYPGAIFLPDSTMSVYGSLYNISQHKRSLLMYLDDYEGIGDQFEHPHEYIRVQIPVTYNNTTIYCWAYLYNLPTTDKVLISAGDYVAYKKSTQ